MRSNLKVKKVGRVVIGDCETGEVLFDGMAEEVEMTVKGEGTNGRINNEDVENIRKVMEQRGRDTGVTDTQGDT